MPRLATVCLGTGHNNLDEAMFAPKGAANLSYQDRTAATLLAQNNTDLNQNVWWRGVVSTSTKLKSIGPDPGPAYL